MTRLFSGLERAFRQLLHLLFPRRCALCRTALPAASRARLCPRCALLLRREFRSTRALRIPGANAVAAPLLFDRQVAAALRRYKFYSGKALGEWFAAQAAVCLAGQLAQWQPDLLTYIPLSPGRWWSRGYNQSEIAAKYLGKAFRIPVRATLGKRLLRGQQARRSAKDRVRLAQSEFFLLPGCPVRGKRVLLIDDVIATGSTAADAVRALREAGALRIYVLALTAAEQPSDERRPYENL